MKSNLMNINSATWRVIFHNQTDVVQWILEADVAITMLTFFHIAQPKCNVKYRGVSNMSRKMLQNTTTLWGYVLPKQQIYILLQ